MALVWIRRAIIPVGLALGVVPLDVIVDDTNSTISYSPSSQWSEGTQCTTCAIHPDPSSAKDGTWHDTTASPGNPRSITFSFTGTAVSVFNILPGIDSSAPTTHVDLTFSLDGGFGTPYQFTPTDDSLQYNVRVFTASELDNTSHSLIIQTASDIGSVVLFDYIVYTIPDPPPSITTTSTTTSSTTTSSSSSSRSSRSSSASSSPSSSLSSSSLPISPSQSSASSTTSSNSISQSISSTSSPSGVIQTPHSVTPQSTGPGSSISSPTRVLNNPSDPVVQPQNVSTGSSVPKGALIGGAVGGGVLLLILVVALLYLLCKRRARRLLMRGGSSAYAEPGERLLPSRSALSTSTSSSVLVIGNLQPDSPVSTWASSERDRTSASAVAPAPLSTYPPPTALVQETTEEKPAILFADEDNASRRLTLPATEPHAQESPAPPVADTRVLERLSAMQEEIARLRAQQAQTSALFSGAVEAPPSYDAA